MGNAVIVHLIRHEKTKANIERRYIGWTDESILYKKAICHLPIDTNFVYGSDLKRCEETAKLYFPNANYQAEMNLRELHFGDFELKTYEQLKNNRVYRDWIDSPMEFTPPNGEHFIAFQERVLNGFQKIISDSGKYVFVIHGGVIRVLLSVFGNPKQEFKEIMCHHRTIYTLQWDQIDYLKEGKRCDRLSVEPITVKEIL
jgi:alpha-ribazole phosphatase